MKRPECPWKLPVRAVQSDDKPSSPTFGPGFYYDLVRDKENWVVASDLRPCDAIAIAYAINKIFGEKK